MKWKIKDVKIDNQVILAPMSGVCDSSFRTIVKSMGCGLVSSEMISTNAVKYGSKKTDKMLRMTDSERPISVQLFGQDSDSFRIASKYVYDKVRPDIIDINMGCPVKKVAVHSNAGSSLLKDPERAYSIVEAVTDTVKIPVTVKIRSGWDKKSVNAVEIAGVVEDAGASGITVHPRTKTQGYSGKADWSIIREVKEQASVPVIGNGDINSCFDAERMIDETGCDAVMIGRGVLGNPWLIKECVDYLDYGIRPGEITIEERINLIKRHVDLFLEDNDEKRTFKKIRNPLSYYVKYFPRNHVIKEKIFRVSTRDELFNLLDEYYKEYIIDNS
ncbi:tRNA dihydrouridine synthase DusB [uncultured Methanosphaera sp.]|uniref:tRNA dihydrouridine synthase DusB n=1 Tax=uncultured Methanosphaera sp. TaxID=262501 RepID=UPI000DC58278|nr:tRNA dihydrouridine synthase DusB [uncultured Methanosphaera sp.]RAP43551.1 MAG: tRNA dihydrouridine synthase DusB [Methanosphaera sp. SHI1033]